MISKANACPSTAALHGATLQPAQQPYKSRGGKHERRAHTLQVSAIVSKWKRIGQHFCKRVLVRKTYRMHRNTAAAASSVVTRVAVQIPAPQNPIVLLPFLGQEKNPGQALQGQVKAQQRLVPRPRRLKVRRLQKRIVGNNALQQLAGVFEGLQQLCIASLCSCKLFAKIKRKIYTAVVHLGCRQRLRCGVFNRKY